MRIKVVRMLALALVLGGVGFALAQSPPGQPGQPVAPPGQRSKAPAEKSKLEGMLAEALKNNPDIRVAAAKMAMAEAELNRTRIRVTQEVVRLHNIMQVQEVEIKRWTTECERLAREAERAIISHEVLEESRQQLRKAKGKLAELEAQMAALLGKAAGAEAESGVHKATVGREIAWQKELDDHLLELRALERANKAIGPMADKMRKALQTPVKVDYKDMTFADILKDLEKKAPGLSFPNVPTGNAADAPRMTLHFEETLPVSAVLQALADEYNMRFVVRDYGIRVLLPLQPPPPGALTVEEFLRQKPAEK